MKELNNDNLSKGISSQISQLSKLAENTSPISKNILLMAENIKKLSASIPRFEIPNYDDFILNIPKFDISKINLLNSELLEKLQEFSKIIIKSDENPELHFAFISNLEILNLNSSKEFKTSLTKDLTDIDIKKKEELLNKNLVPYLEELGIQNLWFGAGQALESNSNPDKLRHCLISLRTILEYLINEKLAPMEKLKNSPMFEKKFKKYHLGKQKIEFVKIDRIQKIEYFSSKIKFGVLEEFTKNEIQYICDCYKILCNVHQPNIGITENQVRSLKVKTGITIWLLVYLNKIIEN